MITRYFKRWLSTFMVRNDRSDGVYFVRSVTGAYLYCTSSVNTNYGYFWPYGFSNDFVLSNNYGVAVGTGGTPATDKDYRLESVIRSGISGTITDTTYDRNEYGDMVLTMHITITNIGSEKITIREVGKMLYAGNSVAEYPTTKNTSNSAAILMDRTVLETPLEIDAGDAGIITYQIVGIPVEHKTIQGVEIVPFEYGTGEQIAAMINAARAGKIDLQEDAGWEIGMRKMIQISEFTGGNNVVSPEQDCWISITGFGDYNNCGSVMQIDFIPGITTKFRMNSTNTNVGGYGASEMKTVTLPAMVEALPTWLKDLLLTFDVLASEGNKSTTIETVSGNKLALRSESEIIGTDKAYSADGEGDEIAWAQGIADPWRWRTNYPWATRSPTISSATTWVSMGASNASTKSQNSSGTNANAVSPFGCL